MRVALVLCAAGVAAALAGCGGGKVSPDQCKKLVDRSIELGWKALPPTVTDEDKQAAADDARSRMGAQLEKCTDSVTPAQLECALAPDKTTYEQMMTCFATR